MLFLKVNAGLPYCHKMTQARLPIIPSIESSARSHTRALLPRRSTATIPVTELWSHFSALWLNPRTAPAGYPNQPSDRRPRGWNARADVCTYLFHLCEHYQVEYLDKCGITCFFDVESGKMPVSVCRALGEIIHLLIIDIGKQVLVDTPNGTITVSLHGRNSTWVLAISEVGIDAGGGRYLQHNNEPLQSLVSSLQGICRTRTAPGGRVTAVLFPNTSCES